MSSCLHIEHMTYTKPIVPSSEHISGQVGVYSYGEAVTGIYDYLLAPALRNADLDSCPAKADGPPWRVLVIPLEKH
eukprot:1860936-Pyramimonas_sp.AAC.2